MKIIIENNSKFISDNQVLKIVMTEIDNVKNILKTRRFYNESFEIIRNGQIHKVSLWINEIKTGITFKFYDEK